MKRRVTRDMDQMNTRKKSAIYLCTQGILIIQTQDKMKG